jgi:hypothetical protein
MDRIWIVAAMPLLLLAVMCCVGVMMRAPGDAHVYLCLAILAGGFLLGLYVLMVVFTGWWHGDHQLTRGDILAALVLASIDVLIPTTLAVLLWLLARSLKGGNLLSF